jgi:NAD(P)-dependent dehydrogenase (short-subunit alcohol dehydrogenase family)
MGRFEGQVALVTGAAGAIGSAVARTLADEGAAVVCADLDLHAAEDVVGTLPDGVAASAVACDVADPASCQEAVAHTLEVHGALDVLAHVAGISAFGHSEDLEPERWERTIAVNLNGTFFMDQAALGPMLDAGRGAIVNMASAAGLRATPYHAAYNASKAGVVMLTRTLAVELAKRGVRVNAVCPGAVDTPFLAEAGAGIPPDADAALLGRGAAPSGQLVTAEQVAAAVAYLASDDAASVTGVALPLDGGATA